MGSRPQIPNMLPNVLIFLFVLFQELHVHIMSKRPTSQVVLEEESCNICTINVQSFVDEQVQIHLLFYLRHIE